MAQQTLEFGVLMLSGYQALDAIGPVDYINNHSHNLLSLFEALPKPLVAKAPVINWHWISFNLDPVIATCGPPQHPTSTYDTTPSLDYLLIPGPDPSLPLPAGCAEFLHKVFNDEKTKLILTVCSGSIVISPTGLLDGLNVCANKMALQLLGTAGKLNKNVKWVGNKRWTKDGRVWSAAGVTAGIDLAAEFVRVHMDEEVCTLARNIMEYTPKPAEPDEFAVLVEGVSLQ